MKKLLIPLAAAFALGVPASALAWGGHHHHHFGVRAAFFTQGDNNQFAANHEGDDNNQFAANHEGDENSQGEDENNDNDGDQSNALFAKLSGTGSSFGDASSTATGSIVAGNDHQNGHFSVSISTNWSQAQSKSFTEEDGDTVTISCAPATASSTLSNGSTSTASLTGKTCSKTENGQTKYGFFGSTSDGVTHLFLKEDGSTVNGFEFSRS